MTETGSHMLSQESGQSRDGTQDGGMWYKRTDAKDMGYFIYDSTYIHAPLRIFTFLLSIPSTR